MCTDKCTRCIGCTLIALAIICITCNAILFFPGWSTEPSKEPWTKLTTEVTSFLGILGGGINVLLPSIQLAATGGKVCCGNRWGMFLSILGAASIVSGALYCITMAVFGLRYGPVCQYYHPEETNTTGSPVPTTNTSLIWSRPFANPMIQPSNESYLFYPELWDMCVEPPNVVEFNIILFSILIAVSSVEAVLGTVQLISSIFDVICRTCIKKDDDYGETVKGEKKENKC
ncbi:transmembrane 4 L6 family member 5-like [Rana temporaria]|uniref:transmembrane 4 L6 family member 5-like n=1 Tax=Rana temporaria TaxID=8407 RepID=UPI001AAC8322|nr:transmembrane 4 L6 family member 5-like [Rana temporaria]